MKLNKLGFLFLVFVLVGVIIFYSVKPPIEITTTIRDTVYKIKDTIIYKEKITIRKVKIIDVDTIVVPPDSTIIQEYKKLYAEYHITNYYTDTIFKDTLNTIVLSEQSNKNIISNRKVNVNIKNREIVSTRYVDKTPKYQIGIGVITSNKVFSPSITIIHNKFLYLGGYDLINKNITVGVFYNFKIR